MSLIYNDVFQFVKLKCKTIEDEKYKNRDGKNTLETSGEDVKIHSKWVRKMWKYTRNECSSFAAVDRELATALESVFPRIGIRTFFNLSAEEKKYQLIELCSLLNGIR